MLRENYVGILLNSSMYRGIPQRKTGQESIANYQEAAREYGLTPCFLRLGDIVPKQENCTAYVWNGTDYHKMIIPVPSVIHNRALYPEAAAHRKIRSLISQGITVFNVNNRYGKDVIHRLLWNAPHLRGYLPVAAPVKPGTLRSMMLRYPDLILKPIRGSVGHGIMRLQYKDNCWELTYSSTREKTWTTVKLRRGELPLWTRRRLQYTPYLIQERIPLAEYESRPLDLRVTVQRGWLGDWGVTGLFVKAAPQGGFVCNIAKGGEAHPAADLLAKVLPAHQVPAVIAHVEALAIAIARHLSSCLPLLADLGLDIGLTAAGQPYFIECNGRDQRYGFRKAELTDTWKDTYRQPMAFARYLLEHPAHTAIARKL